MLSTSLVILKVYKNNVIGKSLSIVLEVDLDQQQSGLSGGFAVVDVEAYQLEPKHYVFLDYTLNGAGVQQKRFNHFELDIASERPS